MSSLVADLADLLDLVLPRRCVGCGSAAAPLCRGCAPASAPFGVACGDLDVTASAAYDDGVRRAIIAYKERGRRDLTRPLAELLAAAVVAARPPPTAVLVAPPSSRAVAASRGGDHMVRLARRVSRSTGIPVADGVLVATRRVRDSAGLGIAERERNLAGSLAARRAAGRTALLVDDIVTTGATLREARRALETAGWPVAGAAVVAATARRVPSRPIGSTEGIGLA